MVAGFLLFLYSFVCHIECYLSGIEALCQIVLVRISIVYLKSRNHLEKFLPSQIEAIENHFLEHYLALDELFWKGMVTIVAGFYHYEL